MKSKQIMETNNYGRYELHEFNRDLEKLKDLESSMKKYGFLNAFPLLVFRNNKNKLVIVDGHHRFAVAQKLGITVKYVEEKKDNIPQMYELENAKNAWKLKAYITSFVREGKDNYMALKNYHDETGIPYNLAAAMLLNGTGGGGNYAQKVKTGVFKPGDTRHADKVADIIKHS